MREFICKIRTATSLLRGSGDVHNEAIQKQNIYCHESATKVADSRNDDLLRLDSRDFTIRFAMTGIKI